MRTTAQYEEWCEHIIRIISAVRELVYGEIQYIDHACVRPSGGGWETLPCAMERTAVTVLPRGNLYITETKTALLEFLIRFSCDVLLGVRQLSRSYSQ